MISKRHRYDSGKYAILPRDVINNSALSFEARGLLLYLLEKPADWTVSNEQLYQQSPAGERHINTILRELKAAGYVHREKVYDPPTRMFRWDTVVYDYPEDNPHHDPSRIPTDRMDTKRRDTKRRDTKRTPTPRMDTKRSDDLILDQPILEEPILKEPIGESAAATGAGCAAASKPTPKPAPVVIHGSRDRTPGGRAPYHGDIPADAPTPVDYRRAKPTPELLARQHPAVAAYWVAVGRHPQRKNESLVIEMVGATPDTAALARAAELWDGSNHNMDNVVGILEWYVELRRNLAWLPSARFKSGKAPAVVPAVATMKEIAPGLF